MPHQIRPELPYRLSLKTFTGCIEQALAFVTAVLATPNPCNSGAAPELPGNYQVSGSSWQRTLHHDDGLLSATSCFAVNNPTD